MDVEIRHLRAFIAVAQAGSLTHASRELHLTQPALSRTIQQLEHAVGVRLLDRSRNGVETTQAGAAFLERACRIVSDLDAALAQARQTRAVRIGFTWALPYPWIEHVITAFESETGAHAHLSRQDDPLRALRRGHVDLALIRHEADLGAFNSFDILTEPRMAVVSRRSPLAGRESLTWAELAEHPVVINTGNGSTRQAQWPEGGQPARTVECASYDEWIALVAAGQGVGSIGRSAARVSAHPGLAFIPLQDGPSATLRLVLPRSPLPPLARTLVEIITGLADERAPG
ncbi:MULTISPECIES: LysR family transcriptional regulator [Actinomyces]|uniref:LysR family transcriptional regulator n=1 Tax=Actinomyces respiraculi TaxID=2744574 RepID=A0A7T0PVQ0_9ACTO|nr:MULTISPECIES: LysR family transcriptional regulator [Actinomyces]QPL04658.1 LysR family transcriptional regulator [Actinomyces respiraculi]